MVEFVSASKFVAHVAGVCALRCRVRWLAPQNDWMKTPRQVITTKTIIKFSTVRTPAAEPD